MRLVVGGRNFNDNCSVQNAIRPIAAGRKTRPFAASETTDCRIAAIMSQLAKSTGIASHACLAHALMRPATSLDRNNGDLPASIWNSRQGQSH